MNTQLGKIESAKVGLGGYDGAMLGMHIDITGKGWGVGYDECFWDYEGTECNENCKWTEADRDKQAADVMKYISKLLRQAKVKNVDQLKGIPVEANFESLRLIDFRILTEVL